MSYDLRIDFPHEVFPREEWDSIMFLFDVEEFIPEVGGNLELESEWCAKATRTAFGNRHAADPEIDPNDGQIVWVYNPDVHVDVYRISPKVWGYCTPVGSQWRVRLSTSGGNIKSLWTQFAIPYYALGFIEGLTAHDCQWHDDENMYSFQDAEEWAKFAYRALASRGSFWGDEPANHKRKLEWIRRGLISEDGRVLF